MIEDMTVEKLIKNNQLTHSNDAIEMRAKRLKRIRNLANLSREELCIGTDINQYTLVGWENGRFGGLSYKGAEKVITRVKKEGVHCTVEWLMEGIGSEPSVNPIGAMTKEELLNLSQDIIMAYELEFFKAKNPNAVNLIVDDEGMLPQYHIGDMVAGKKRIDKEIEFTVGTDCIVETSYGEKLLRNVRAGKHKNKQCYTLVCTNSTMTAKPSVISDVELIYAAPVIWHRKKDI